MTRCLFIGSDPHQAVAWAVAVASARQHATDEIAIEAIDLFLLRAQGLYTRPTDITEHGYTDLISQAPMATAHAIARFFVPLVCEYQGWAIFTDGDVLFRHDVGDLFALADPSKALQVVQHEQLAAESVKMTGVAQTQYPRKNWSSVMLINCAHPSHQKLDQAYLNMLPGRSLHRFCWLADEEIGALPAEWNVLIGEETHPDPALVHFTLGLPTHPGYEHQPYCDEWYATARACGYPLEQPAPVSA